MEKKGIPSYRRFEGLIAEKAKTVADVVREAGVDAATMSHWKSGDYAPKTEKLYAIAKCLDVPLEALLD